MRSLLAILAILAFPAYGADILVTEGGGDRVVLDVTPCVVAPVIEAVKPPFKEKLRSALYLARPEGQKGGLPPVIKGCWIDSREVIPPDVNGGRPPAALTVWEDGDSFAIPLSRFSPGTEADKRPQPIGQPL